MNFNDLNSHIQNFNNLSGIGFQFSNIIRINTNLNPQPGSFHGRMVTGFGRNTFTFTPSIESDSDSDDDSLPPQTLAMMMRIALHLFPELLASRMQQEEKKPQATSKSIRDNLPQGQVKLGDKCAVCLEEYGPSLEGRKVVKLECDHLFHKECILPWLEQNNSCPTCRHLLESDDPEWNRENKEKLEEAQNKLRKRQAAPPTPSEEEHQHKSKRSKESLAQIGMR